MASSGNQSVGANDVIRGNLVRRQMDQRMGGNVPADQLSATPAQYVKMNNRGTIVFVTVLSQVISYADISSAVTRSHAKTEVIRLLASSLKHEENSCAP